MTQDNPATALVIWVIVAFGLWLVLTDVVRRLRGASPGLHRSATELDRRPAVHLGDFDRVYKVDLWFVL